ncbi:hypothetical protein Tco_0027032 [Tanacetum coccineum]
MSDLEDSTVTYTEVSSPFEDLSNIGSPEVDELPMMLEDPYVGASLQASPSPDYVPVPKHPPLPVYVPYVSEPVYLEFMPPEDDVLPAEEQPLPAVVLPTADSLGYITESDLEEDDEDRKEDLADYPTNREDDEDEDEDEDEDKDEDEDEDDDEEEEEEHPAPADSVLPPVHRVTARMYVRAQTSISLPLDIEVARLLAIPTPPPSPLSPLSSPLPQILSPLPQILSLPLPVSPPPLPAGPTYPLGYRPAMIRLRAESPSTSHPLPLPSPIVLPHTKASVAMMKVVAPSTYILASRSETPQSGTPPLLPIPLPIPTRGFRADYGFVGTLDNEIRQDTYEIYRRLDDAENDRLLMSGQLNMLRKDRRAHARTARLMETEARLSREAWVQSMGASDSAHSEVRAL